jgi:hypothetical protein
MTVKRRRRARPRALPRAGVAGLIVGMAVAGAGTAAAHPEFSALGTNRYVTVAVFDGRVDVADALLEGTLASGDERRRLDVDGDGRISDAERGAAEARLRAEGATVTVEVDGRALPTSDTVAIDLGDDARASAAPVVVEHRLTFPGAFPPGARRVRVAIAREPSRLIETEIDLVLGPGLALAGGEDRVTFRGPRTSSLEERAATFEIAGPPAERRRTWIPFALAGVAALLVGGVVRRRRTPRA